MNILFVLPQIPYPPHSGGRIVTWNTVKRFAAECRVRIVCLYHHPSELEAIETVRTVCEEIAAFPAHGKWSIQPGLKSIVSSKPYKAHRFWNPQMAGYIQRLLKRAPVDVIHAQNFYTAGYVTGQESCVKVHYKENVEGNLLLRLSRHARNPLLKLAARLEGHRTRRYELRLCRRFDRVLTISPIDCQTLLSLDPSLPVRHQKPGVDVDAYPFLEEAGGAPTVVFTGTMSYYPNAMGVELFLKQVWPVVHRRVPEAECWIVGSDPSNAIRQHHGSMNIHVTGRVNDVDEYLKKAWVYIVPLTIGGGIRLKILEAMASGRAIVSTPVGAEGLDVQHQTHVVLTELDQSFADSIVNLLRQRERRERMRASARRLVETEYNWDRIIPQQVELYRSLCLPPGRLSEAIGAGEQG